MSVWQRLIAGSWHVENDADWSTFTKTSDPDGVMSAAITDHFHAKQGRSIARWELMESSRKLVVFLKRHYRWSFGAGALATLFGHGRSAAVHEHANLKLARELGFAVPRPVAVGEKVGPWLSSRSFLAIEELTGMLPLHEAIPTAAMMLPPAAFANWKRGLIAELARVVRRLHGLRLFHKDLYLCHFYVPQDLIRRPLAEWTGRLAMIDLHRMARHPWTWPWWQAKDIAQLGYSTDGVVGVSVRDRLRFWRTYAGLERRERWPKLLKRITMIRWSNYKDHNSARKSASSSRSAA